MDIVYVKFDEKVQVEKDFVMVSDVAEIVCKNNIKKNAVNSLQIHQFIDTDRDVLSALYVVATIEATLDDVCVIPLGAIDIILEYTPKQSKHRLIEIMKVVFVSMVSFFGTGFTIMAFHNDIGIRGVFMELSSIITGEKSIGAMVLEVSYAIGLSAGILLFFNHVGKRRITHDPTPIEVSMRNYEDDVNKTLAETWDREGKTIEAP